jgi:DNA-binding transcriptional ArsR family regulator
MPGFEEETYSTIFASLKHPVRRKILRMLSEKPRSFSEILEALGISSSHLTYHLENLGELVSKMDDGKYKLSTFGEAGVGTMSKVEEMPKVTERKRSPSLATEWKSFCVGLMIGLVVLAGVSYIQYQSSNRVFAEYEQLKELVAEYEQLKELVELVENGAVLQSEYTLRNEFDKVDSKFTIRGPWWCVIYVPYDNFTLDLVLLACTVSSESYIPISVQEGDVFILGYNETASLVWSANATVTGIYSVPLASKGWYTISLVGPITHTYPLTVHLGDDDCWMSLRIIYKGKFSPFIVIEPH